MTKIWIQLINQWSSMRNHPPQRKLRRSFGSQPVGCLGGPSQPEAGIAVQVTQAQSSLRTFLCSNDGHLANLVAGDYGDADQRTLLRPLPWHLLHILHERREARLSHTSRKRQALLSSSKHSIVSSGVTVPSQLVAVKPHLYPLPTTRNQKPDR